MSNSHPFRFWQIVGIGLLIRIFYAIWLGDSWMTEDAGGYFQDAVSILAGKQISPFWPPGVPYYVAVCMWITGPNTAVATGGMLLWYVAFCWSFSTLVRHWLRTKTIHFLLLGFSVYPAFIHHSVAPLSHLPVTVCLLMASVLVLRIHSSSPFLHQLLSLSGIGLLLGLMGLFRPGAIVLIPVFVGGIFLLIRSRSRHAWAKALFPLLFAGLILGGWELSLFQQHQRWVGINDATAMNLFIGNNPHTPLYKSWWLGSHDETQNPDFQQFYDTRSRIRSLPLAEQKTAFAQEAWRHIQARPDLFLLRSLNRIRCFFAFDTYTGARAMGEAPFTGMLFLLLDAICYLLLGYFAIGGIKKPEISQFWSFFFVGLILAYSFPYFLAFSHPTYHFAILPIVSIFAGRGIESGLPPRNWSLVQKVGIAIFALIQIEWAIFMLN